MVIHKQKGNNWLVCDLFYSTSVYKIIDVQEIRKQMQWEETEQIDLYNM